MNILESKNECMNRTLNCLGPPGVFDTVPGSKLHLMVVGSSALYSAQNLTTFFSV